MKLLTYTKSTLFCVARLRWNFISNNILVVVFLFFTSKMEAQNIYTWNGGSGNWSDNNWTCVGTGCVTVPTATDNAIINSGVITIGAPATINDLTLSGSPDINGANMLTVNGTLDWKGAEFIDVPITVEGTLDLTDATGFGRYMNGSATLTLNSTTNHSYGTIFVHGTNSIINNGTFNLSGTGIWHLNIGSPTFTNQGTMDISKNGNVITGAAGSFTNASSGIIRLSGSTGTRTISRPFTNNGRLEGQGTLKLDNTFAQNGTVAPGFSPGIFGLNKLVNTGGVLTIEMQDDGDGNPATPGTPGTDYDQVAVTGAATLGGTLDIVFLNGYEPTVGNQWTILTCNPCSGSFASINHPGNNPNAFQVSIVGTEVILTLVQALPVELTIFSAHVSKEQIELEWETASETNNEGFEIQKSSDGREWRKIGFVAGKGTAHDINNYQLIDPRPFNGINYYRLKQMDFDGGYEYSKIISAVFSGKNDISIYPNPTGGFFKINKMEAGKYKISDSTGNIVKSGAFANSTIDIAELNNGIYSIQLFSDQIISVKMIVKK